MSLPQWLTDKLAHVPEAGGGIHAWLFSCARQLHAHMPPDAVAACLTAATANASRRVTQREIRDAVRNSHSVAWTREDKPMASLLPTPSSKAAPEPSQRWPKPDPAARRCRVLDAKAAGVGSLADLWEASPVRPDILSPEQWLDLLLPGADWICLAVDHPATARTRPPGKWAGKTADCGLVVPSPMTGPSGQGLDGRLSHRCLGNTGPRRWLVLEFDKLEDGKTPMPLDDQAALHWHFGQEAAGAGWPPLALVLHSGSKSLHGWYGPVASEDSAKELMAYAITLGADPATWNRCQLVRLPGGRRASKPQEAHLPEGWETTTPTHTAQHVFFYHPTPCNLTSSSLAPFVRSTSTHPPAAQAA